MTPNEATEPINEFLASWNIREKAKYDRKYPPLSVDDNVRVLQKKTTKTKGYFPKRSANVYKVRFIKDGDYLIDDTMKRKVYRRHELLKV